MDKFKILYDRLTNLSDTYKSDKKIINDIASVKIYVTTQEKYYNLIPINIRTTNTLQKIITNLSHKIDQITHMPQQNYVTVNPNYEEDTVSDANCDTITLAYLTQQVINATDKISSDEKINALQDDLVQQQTTAAKQIQDLQDLQAANDIDKAIAAKQIQDLQDLQAANDIVAAKQIQDLQDLQAANDIVAAKQIQDLQDLQAANDIVAAKQIQDLQAANDIDKTTAAKQIQDLQAANDIVAAKQIQDLQAANDIVAAKQIQDLQELQAANDIDKTTAAKQIQDLQTANIQELQTKLREQKNQDDVDCSNKLEQQQLLFNEKNQPEKNQPEKKQESENKQIDQELQALRFTDLVNKYTKRYDKIFSINNPKFEKLNIVTLNIKKYDLQDLNTDVIKLIADVQEILKKYIENSHHDNIILRINSLKDKIKESLKIINSELLLEITGAGPDAQSEESYCSIM